MRRACLFITLILLSLHPAATAADQGDAAYERKAYAEAARAYQQLIARDSGNALAWYKLGNAQYRLRHTGEAAYAYARALYLQPAFDEAAANLELIQRQVSPVKSNPVFFLRWWAALTRPALTNVWAVLAFICFSAPLLGIAYGRMKKRGARFVPPQLTGLGISLGLLFVILAVAAARGSRPRHQAVVMKQDAAARPAVGKSESVILPEGLLVDVLRTGAAEIQIELPDGRDGFIQRSDIALIE